uniref:Putative UDP-glucose/GDP-mannose dehydrogenasese n=1 Tax=viral metagenome TaxID=1070528 RepID=A0A6M3M2D2_9ZZZZ
MKSKVFIVGGLGHIGLTLAAVLSKYYKTTLFDVNEKSVYEFKSNQKATFYEPGLNKLLKGNKNLFIAENISECKSSDYIIVTIGTPIDEYLNPKLKEIFFIINELSKYLTNQTVILRSTIYPGLTKKLEKRFQKTVKVAFCPERIAGSVMIKELKILPQIISANSQEAIDSACELFRPLHIKTKILHNTTEGELAKLFTNSFRYIEFAIANQFFMMAQDLNCDFYKIYDAIVSDYPRMKNLPKPGFSGSYCLRKDSIQLASSQNGATFSLAYDASLINESMPLWVFRQIREKYKNLDKKIIGILGMAFKPGCDDIRDSLSYRMKNILENEVKEVLCSDSYVKSRQFVNAEELLKKSDIIILMTPHDQYKELKIKKPFVDIWNFWGKGTGL